MTRYIAAALLVFAFGCSQQSIDRSSTYEEDLAPAQPAGSTIHPAEATGYIDTVDPEAFPPTPGDANPINQY